jgi:hypothetical protein
MALQKQDLQVVLGTGVDTKADPKLVQPGALLVLENGVLDSKRGSIYKRVGNSSLPPAVFNDQPGDTLEGILKVTTLGDELVAITKTGLYAYSEDLSQWIKKGVYANCTLQSDTVLRDARNIYKADMCICNDKIITASIALASATSDLVVQILDKETKKVLEQKYITTAGTIGDSVKCVVRGDDVFIYYIDGTTVFVIPIDATAGQFSLGAAAVVGPLGIQTIDACNYGDEIVLVSAATGSGFNVTLSYIKADGTEGGVADGLPADPVTFTSVAALGTCRTLSIIGVDGGYLYLSQAGASTASDLYTRIYDSTFTLVASATVPGDANGQIRGAVACIYNSLYTVFYNVQNQTTSGSFPYYVKVRQVSDAGVITTLLTNNFYQAQVYAKPFFDSDGYLYLPVSNAGVGSEQKSYFITKLLFVDYGALSGVTRFFPVAQGCPYEGQSDGSFIQYNGNITEDPDNPDVFYGAFLRSYAVTRFAVGATPQTNAQAVVVTKIVLNDADATQVVESDNSLLITGGILWNYDGNTTFEHGFLHYPFITTTTQAGATGVAIGTYNYVATYEWTDYSANKHFSAPSLPFNFAVTGSARTVSNVIFGMNYTYRGVEASITRNLGVCNYRTVTGPGSVYYRVASTSPENENNVVTTFTVTVTDNRADASLTANELLYTTGGVLENLAVGSAKSITLYQGRVIVSNKEFKYDVAYSKSKTPTVAYQFNPLLSFRIDNKNESVVAVSSLDDKLILFTDRNIFIQAGQGPSDTGTNSDYLQNAQRIATDIGCSVPKSIVRYNDGLIFKSEKGFYKLDRSLSVSYVGEPVEYYNTLDCREGVLMEDRNEIRWVHSDGVCLVYNYIENQWSTFTNHEAVSCCVWKGQFVMAKTDGEIWVENSSTYLDDGVAYSRRIVTPWFALAGLQHAQRLYRILVLGEMRSPHILRCYISYNYEPARREEFVFDSLDELGNVTLANDAYYTTPPTYSNEDRTYDIEMRPSIQKCESFRLEIYDENATTGEAPDPVVPTDGACCVLTSITLQVGVKPSTLRPSTGRRAIPQ